MQSINEYIDSVINSDDFNGLLELKEIINKKYSLLIISLKSKEALYNDALKNKDYYKDFDKIKDDFILAKKKLYEKEEVKLYFTLERKIQKSLDEDLNKLKASISNKFKLKSFLY